jgi:ABC-type molybdate transport system substrate-binding protein
VNYDIRYIQLEKQVNLGAKEFDYSKAEVTFEKPGRNEKIKIKGSPITFSLSIPENARNREAAIRFIRWLFTEQAGLFETKGFSFFKPVFYGTREDYEPFKDFVVYGGEF